MTKKSINLALQGGGAHGALTWGVLDKLAEDGRFDITGLSGTSAGAMNAIVYADGLMENGNDGAREKLEKFWWEISKAGMIFSPVKYDRFTPFDMHPMMATSYFFYEMLTHSLSPYQFNPANFNPLRTILERTVDFERIHTCDRTNMFVCATNIERGIPRVFRNEEITVEAVLASACLPDLFQAVEIDGEHYWDGGYTGNPALYPLIYGTGCTDFLIVHINPIVRPGVPKTAKDIMNRLNEVTFNASLIKEMRAIAFVQKLINQEWIKDEYKDKLKKIRMHAIRADEEMRELGIASKFASDWSFLTYLRDLGRFRAEEWLKRHYKDIGTRASIDIHEEYL